MSRATLYVRFPDGTVRYGIYEGTVDVVAAQLFSHPQEAWDAYEARALQFDRPTGVAEGAGEPVDAATDYLGGHWWTATATRDWVTSRLGFGEQNETAGLPDWARPR